MQGAAPSQTRQAALCRSSPDTRTLGLRAPCHTVSVTAAQLTPSALQEEGALLPSEADPSTGSFPASEPGNKWELSLQSWGMSRLGHVALEKGPLGRGVMLSTVETWVCAGWMGWSLGRNKQATLAAL